jgi:hypothetical protein
MAKPLQFEPEKIIEALVASKGMVYITAKKLKCSPQTIYNYAKEYPEVQEAIDSARGELTDTAESKLAMAIRKGESWAVCFYLKTQGRNRGYVERQEVSADFEIKVIHVDGRTINS